MAIVSLTKENFDTVVGGNPIVIVDFWAEWCSPCRSFAKIFEVVSELNEEDVVFAKVNVEEEKELVEDFNIRSIPFIMIFRGDTVVYAEAGVLTKEQLEDLLNKAKELSLSDLK